MILIKFFSYIRFWFCILEIIKLLKKNKKKKMSKENSLELDNFNSN